MIIKKFVPCIYLYHEHAVRNLTDTTIVDTDPVRLADYYCEHNADELIVFDMSEGDAEHDAALDIIKEICTRAEVDVIGAGNVKRMEDIKKLLYAGCKKAVLDYEKESNIEITEEVSLKFGKDKILISYNDPSVLELHKEKIEKYISAMILMNPHQIRETQAILSLPFFVQINQVALNKLLEIFAYENVCGVTGNTINDNVKEIVALKDLCRENDIPIESFQAAYKWEDFKKNSDGMVPVIVQDYRTQEVLMMAYMNEEAYEQTLKLGKMTYYSRSRQELWLKGLTSGHYQYVKELNVIPSLLSCFDNPIKVKTEDEEGAKEAEKEIMVRIEIISNEQSNIWRTMNAIDVLSSIHNEVREVLQDSDWNKYKELSHMYIS